MPRLQDIERFKRDLSALSHEAEVLERWGEKPEKIQPPSGAAVAPPPEEASDEVEESREPSPALDNASPPDFAALLDGLPLGEESETETAPPSALDDDLARLFGSPDAQPETFEASAEEGESPREAEAFAPEADDFTEAPEASPGTPSGESFDFGDMPSLDEMSFGETEAAPVEAEKPDDQPAEDAIEEIGDEAEALEALTGESPDFGANEESLENLAPAEAEPRDFQAEEEMPALFEEGSQGNAPAGDDMDFSIPDFETDEAGEGSAEKAGAEENAAQPDDFSIPDLSEGLSEEGSSSDFGSGFPSSGQEPAPAASEDSFDSFSFDEPSAFPSSFGNEGAGQDLDSEIASLSEEAPVADTFKLDQDWGDFGGFGGETKAPPPPKAAPARPGAASAKAQNEEFKAVSLSETQVDRLQDSLLDFPLNLRVAVEDILANEKGSEAQRSKLVWAMVEGQTAEQIALMAGRIQKRQIPIPKGYEKRTGASLEAEKGTLAYAFVHTFLPIIRIGLLVLAIGLSLGYLGWRFIYVPIAADSLYRTGYHRIAEERYAEANTDFDKATRMREFPVWYYRYAQAFVDKRQYLLAEDKYADLVARHPEEKKGILAWARLEKDQLKYEEAVDVLKGVPPSRRREANARGKTGLLNHDYFNPDGLLLLGDVYLDWGEEDPGKYEKARQTYATLIEHYGDEEEYLQRMLLYFIRVDENTGADKKRDVLSLRDHFMGDPKRQVLDAQVLAELGGYLLDKGMLDGVRSILLAAVKKDPTVPEAHYNLARYMKQTNSPDDERKALDNSIRTFSALPGLGGKRAGMYVDSLVWRADFLSKAKEWIGAEQDYAAAVAQYEAALELKRVQPGPRFGAAYAGLGNIAYWQRDDLSGAFALYEKAAANGYSTPDTYYRSGNILYRQGRYADALERFYHATHALPAAGNPQLDYAMGSCFLARNDYYSAEACYRRLADTMDRLLDIVGEPMPQESLSQAQILGLDMRAQNNLGVALYHSAARSGDSRRRNQAMASFAKAARLYDQLSKDPGLLEGSEGRNLPLANMNTLIQSPHGDKLSSYTDIAKDMDFQGL